MALRLDPVVRDEVDVRAAHEVLHEHVQAVLQMLHLQGPRWGMVMLVERRLAQRVQAVDLVEDVDLHNVRVRSQAP